MTQAVATTLIEAAIASFAVATAAATFRALTGRSAVRRRVLRTLRLAPTQAPDAARSWPAPGCSAGASGTDKRSPNGRGFGTQAGQQPNDRALHHALTSLLEAVGRKAPSTGRHAGLQDQNPFVPEPGSPSPRLSRRPEDMAHWSDGAVRGAAVLTAAAGILAGALSPVPALGCPLLALAGYRLPTVAVAARTKAARRALHAALPETADLLAVSTNAGLNVVLALQRTAHHAPEPIRSELDRVNGEIALGRSAREALADFADRTDSDEVRGLVSILTGGDRFGARISGSIERWASDLWTRRRHELETEARRAPVKILFPLVFLILPAFLLTTVVPLLLSTLRMLGYDP